MPYQIILQFVCLAFHILNEQKRETKPYRHTIRVPVQNPDSYFLKSNAMRQQG
jgi:hypothetical protein